MFASLLPLMMARTASFPKADQFCAEQKAQIDPAAELGESIYPVHLGNCLSMFACFCLSLVVFYRSPHMDSSSDQARMLDKKCAFLSSIFSRYPFFGRLSLFFLSQWEHLSLSTLLRPYSSRWQRHRTCLPLRKKGRTLSAH